MAKKRGNNRNTKAAQHVAPKMTASTPNSSAKTNSLSEDDQKLLELAQKAKLVSESELDEFKSMLMDEYSKEYDEKKANMDQELEAEKEVRKKEFEESLKKEHQEAIAENERLQKETGELEKKISSLEKSAGKIEGEQQKILDDAKKEAERIIEEAKKEAEKQNEEALKVIEEKKKELAEREEIVEDREIELDGKDSALKIKEKRIQQQASIYETANPDAVASLERALELRAAQLESVQHEFEEAQMELNKIRIRMIRSEGVSPEEQQQENDALRKRVEELEDKCSRFTEQQLNEMLAAYESKDAWLTQIRNLQNDNAAKGLELTRLNNSIREYEQLKAQLDLLRTLNEHLRAELNNTKRMLESNVGEICPALTAIDVDESANTGDSYVRYGERQSSKNESITTLKELVDHVKRYAAAQSKPLYYSDQDLRAFIAGLAASPLSILQGMSGTGKTSLPKIFCEAIMGEICVVPVESSWRDRNELLGYYNDFSKKFTAKEFTCDLYRAGCERYENTIYFIVLDEMNLSRVEYYFADFLSVLEDKKENWIIRLVDTDMRQLPTEITEEVIKAIEKDKSDEARELEEIVSKLYPENNTLSDDANSTVSGSDKLKLIKYLADKNFKNKTRTRCLVGGPQHLIDGNTIRIPRNVWFIGTANRDESTFEITDKVYDRAQVLNFNNRATGSRLNEDVPRIFLTYGELSKMFMNAVNSKTCAFKAEECELLKEIESILRSNFRISYGNRIQDQMNIFVPVYIAAGISATKGRIDEKAKAILINEAIDFQLTNKVLRKLEYEELSKEAAQKLRTLFEKHGLVRAKDFIDWKTGGVEG